jgi:hypothetical protein
MIGGMLIGGLASCRPAPEAAVTDVGITRPTVIAYFIVPPGAVDTSRDLAVEADDWNVSMATLRDSLDASGIGLAMTTQPNLRLRIAGKRDRTLILGTPGSAGYVFVAPDRGPCVRAGGADADWVMAAARAFAASKVAGCT